MPGCSAFGCNNRSEKGYKMKCFPSDPKLRKIWQERVGRADWEPSKNSFLCHEHFEIDKWHMMENGKIKLEKDAIPSIFAINTTRRSAKKRIELLEDSIKSRVIKTYSVKKRMDEEKKSVDDSVSNLADNSNQDFIEEKVKKEELLPVPEKIKEEEELLPVPVGPCNYDEIEEKLKQICDGYFEENNSNNIEKPQLISNDQKEVLHKTPVYRSINYKHSSGNNIGHMLTNDTENIEIIFSAENVKEDTCIHKCAPHNEDMADETEMLDPCIADTDTVSNDKEIERNINVTPNIMAAMKRKRRTRDEIMRSIEKSICNASASQDTNSLSDSDVLDDTTEVEDQKKKILKIEDDSSSDAASPTTTRFTVKVSGHPDDVSDIMHNLSRNIADTSFQEYNDRSSEEEDGFVTSVITIDDCPIDVDDKARLQDNDPLSCRDITSNDRILPSTSRNSRYLNRQGTPHFDEELNDLSINNRRLIPIKNTAQSPTNDHVLKCKYEKLQRKLSVQANVVKELSSQLISCKRTEYGLQNKNSTLEKKIQSMADELSTLSSDVSPPRVKKNLKQNLIDDLTSKISHFEQVNKKLAKSSTVTTEQVKKLESQIKQRDNKIKELNWKLDKASKYLERAEKNTNTYRRKMMNMQSFLKRKKLLDEKLSKFNEILVDVIKKGYTNKILPMSIAMRIKKTCGTTEYDKLLQSGFPLPTLVAVRIASDNMRLNEILPTPTSECNVNKAYNTKSTGNHIQVVYIEDSKNIESVDGKIGESREKLDDTQTVMGTVQDIFDENSDDDDFSTNELTEDFILQLHKLM